MSSVVNGIVSGADLVLGGFLLPICPPAGIALIAGGSVLAAKTIKNEINRNHINIITNELFKIIPQ